MMPFLGHGIGLRNKHYTEFLESRPGGIDWVEAISENFMTEGGRPLAVLEKVRSEMPVVLHGVAMSVGGVDGVSADYLSRLSAIVQRFEPAWVSDHLCFGTLGGHYAHELLPLPYSEECLNHVVEQVTRVQDSLQRPILLENVSSYVTFAASAIPEWEFLSQVARRSGCGILLDVNNIFVSAFNHGFDPYVYLNAIPKDRVGQIHLAGHSDKGNHLLDTHDASVPDPVWDLYRAALKRFGAVSTLVEWDDHIPPLAEVIDQASHARSFMEATLDVGASSPRVEAV